MGRLGEMIDFALASERRPKQDVTPFSLYMTYTLNWRAAQAATARSFGVPAMAANQLGVMIDDHQLFLQPSFSFEGSDTDPGFIKRLLELECAMPFVPRDDCYFRIEPKKTGKGNKLVKLQKGWKHVA